MSELLKKIDARTKLAGTNKLEILLFSLGVDQRTGRKETFGINVFKVREVMRTPEITSAPEMPASVEGMVSLRGSLVPVIDLAKYAGIISDKRPEIMIVTEYNGHTQGFLVEAVDTILRLDWAAMRVPPDMITNRMGGLVTAVTELDAGTLVMMMDVEKVLAETAMYGDEHQFVNIEPLKEERMVYFADDSAVARKQIERTFQAMQVKYAYAINGMRAWDDLQRMASQADLARSQAERYRASGADRRGNAGDGRLHADQDDQVRPALCRHSGADAFLAVRPVEPETGRVGRGRCLCIQIRTAEALDENSRDAENLSYPIISGIKRNSHGSI